MTKLPPNVARDAANTEHFPGGGEMGERIRAFDWADTALGPVSTWSPSLKMMVRFLLANRFPMLLWWGPDFIQIYNDPYRPVLGAKHPTPGLGQPVSVCWSEIWDVLRPLIETPYRGGSATWMDDILLLINRHGFDEETHFTIAYSPVPDDSVPGGIGGVLATVNEITEKVLAERRVTALRDLGARVGAAKSAEEACRIAAQVLGEHDKDLPFVLFYLVEPDGTHARLAGSAGTPLTPDFAPERIALTDPSAGWPVPAALTDRTLQLVPELGRRFGAIPAGPWTDPPHQAAVVPITAGKSDAPVGVMIAGISSRLRFDQFYRDFVDFARTQVSAAITNAHAYEEERRRAESLAELDRVKTEFFSNISHEFRTPLTLMLGPVEEMLNQAGSPLPAEDRARLDIVHRNSLRLLKLVNTLLDFSRIEAGRMEAQFAPLDLAAFTAELAGVFRSAIEHAGLRFAVDCPALPGLVAVDRELWEKIVLNLLSNAFKYTLAGEIAVELRPVGDRVQLTVRDTGVGIPAAELPRVFERFYRVQDSRGRTHEGTGIGLALVQELVRLHGGTITVTSVVGQGTSFVVDLPFASVPSDAPAAPAPASVSATHPRSAASFERETARWISRSPAAPPARVGTAGTAAGVAPAHPERPRILWAEDNPDMREYVQRLLAEHCDVVAVGDGQAALESARAAPPELILSDVMMPRLDGFGLLRELKHDPALAPIPVILLSARAGEEALVGGVGSGADDYLIKPFSARELLARVEAHVRLFRTRRAAEAAVRKSEERFRALLTAGAYVVYRMSPDWTEMTTLDGRGFLSSVSQPTPNWLESFIPLDEQPLVQRTIATAIATKSIFELEHRVLRADGQIGWTSSRAVPLFDVHGEIREWFGAATDITARKEAEFALRDNEAGLRRARDEALAANRAKDEFLAMLSHELRTPLNPVLLIATDSAGNLALPPIVRENFKTIADNVSLQARLIDDLLDLNRITRGKVALERDTLDVHEILRGAATMTGEDIRAKRIKLTLELRAAATTIEGDPVRLQQVFWNVLKNAVKFTATGGLIAISSSNPPGTREVEVRIRDSGIGMEPDELTRIFHPFVQGRHALPETDTHQSYGGLGLGLAISRMLVEVHGGTIQAESAGAQRGTVIVIRLPLRAAPAKRGEEGDRDGALSRPSHGLAKRAPVRRILFVEDHAPTRAAMVELLKRRGYEVTAAQSMTDALAQGRAAAFDVLISDIGLPDGDGCSLMSELRRHRPSLPGIAISGYGMADDLSRSRAVGFGEHLTKPISIDSLERALARLLGT